MSRTTAPMRNVNQPMHNTRRKARSSTGAAAAWALALAAAAAALPIALPAAANADACGSVGGQHWSVSGCADPGQYVPPPDNTPNATVCAQGGRWINWSACK